MNNTFGGNLKTNPTGGHDIIVHATQGFGNEKINATAGVFAATNTLKGPTTSGVFAEVNAHAHGLSVQHANTHGVGSNLSENARVNLMQGRSHSVDINAFHSRTQQNNGLNFDKIGGNLAWNHAQGHSASFGVSQIPKFNMNTIEAAGKANLWISSSGATSLDLTGNAQKHLSGPFAGQKNFGAGLGLNHRF